MRHVLGAVAAGVLGLAGVAVAGSAAAGGAIASHGLPRSPEAGPHPATQLLGVQLTRTPAKPLHGPATQDSATHGPAKSGPATHGPAKSGPATHGPAKSGPATHGPTTPEADDEVPSIPPGTIRGDRAKIVELDEEIATEGDRAEALVEVTDRIGARADRIAHRLARADEALHADRTAAEQAGHRLAAAAVAEYVDAGSDTPALAGPAVGSGAGSADAEVYANAAAGALDSLITAYRDAEHRVTVGRVKVEHELAATEVALRRYRAAQQVAERAVHADNAVLLSVRGNLRKLLAEAAAREEAEEDEEKELAEHFSKSHPSPATPVEHLGSGVAISVGAPVEAPQPASTGYVNPLRGVAGLSTSRIDQGVDYCGEGPIYAIGDGVVLSTFNGGWPGGTYITYQLSSGPAAGLVVYDAEDIDPSVSIGQSVNSSTVLGTLYEGPTCMETGWADGGAGDTMAMDAQQFFGANSTAFGYNFDQLLISLGAPGGQLQALVATGSLPVGWPSW